MGRTALAVENFFSTTQFPLHTRADGNPGALDAVTYSLTVDEPSGFEAYHVANGRRSQFDYWQPVTSNTGMYLRTICDRVRGANYIALDRGHNLGGFGIKLECSQDNWVTIETVVDLSTSLLPTASMPGAIGDPQGVRTQEGAWIKRFPYRTAKYWRLNIPPMGVGLTPKIVGLWLGLSIEVDLYMPASDDANDLISEEGASSHGWLGRSHPLTRGGYTLLTKLVDYQSYDQPRYHIVGHFAANRPMWIVHDTGQADRAILALRGPGRIEPVFMPNYGFRTLSVPWIEHEPKLAA